MRKLNVWLPNISSTWPLAARRLPITNFHHHSRRTGKLLRQEAALNGAVGGSFVLITNHFIERLRSLSSRKAIPNASIKNCSHLGLTRVKAKKKRSIFKITFFTLASKAHRRLHHTRKYLHVRAERMINFYYIFSPSLSSSEHDSICLCYLCVLLFHLYKIASCKSLQRKHFQNEIRDDATRSSSLVCSRLQSSANKKRLLIVKKGFAVEKLC